MEYQICTSCCSKCGAPLTDSLKVGMSVESWCYPGWELGVVKAIHLDHGLIYVQQRHSDGELYTSTKVPYEVRAKCKCEDFWVHWRRNPVGNALALAVGATYIIAICVAVFS